MLTGSQFFRISSSLQQFTRGLLASGTQARTRPDTGAPPPSLHQLSDEEIAFRDTGEHTSLNFSNIIFSKTFF